MSKSLTAVLFIATLFASISVSAQDRKDNTDRPQQHGSNQPYYDSKHKDWHQWNDQENQAYQRYEQEHHMKDRDFASTSEAEQQQYWNWRHKHPDSH